MDSTTGTDNGVAAPAAIDRIKDAIAGGGALGPLPNMLAQIEAELLRRALIDAGGVIAKAAEVSGIPEPTFRRKMARHGVKVRRVAVDVAVGDYGD